MTTTLTIRQYKPEDQKTVRALHNAALFAVGAHAGNGPWDDDLHAIEQIYLENGGEFLVGTLDRSIVAMGALRRTSPERAEIKRMRVDPVWQRRGFGEQVLAALEQRAGELGYRTLHLDTTMQNHAAQQLYRKHGWTEVGRGDWRDWQLIYYEKLLGDR
jgi:ribosomal protein S18 acetylase RimI-like enzyme